MGQIFSYEADRINLPEWITTYADQSRAVKGEVATRTSHYNRNDDDLLKTIDPTVTTVYEAFTKGLEVAGADGGCLGYRPTSDAPYRWLSYQHVHDSALAFGCALRSFDLSPGEKTFIGFYAQNRPEWIIASLGSVSQSMVIVPLYDTLGLEAVEYILNQTDIEIVICDTMAHAKVMLDNYDRFPHVRRIVVMDKINDTLHHEQITLHAFDDVVSLGKQKPLEANLPTADDLYMLCYTSGTTGNPKGVMMTHGNLIAFASTLRMIIDEFGVGRGFQPGCSTISYLPLAHSFEQLIHATVLQYGMQIGYYRGNIATLLDDCKALKPTVFPVVPRLLNKLYDKVQANLTQAGGVSKWLFERGYAYKLNLLRHGVSTKNSWADRLIFRKIQAELGGCVEFMATGAAPIADDVLTMSRVALGCVLVEGYGQTESAAACTGTLPGDWQAGHVGAPMPCVRVKLVDIPDMNYWAKDSKGEICIKGHTVMRGYYKEEAKTRETLDADGWLHTGDVGTWLPNGTLKIIDRKKHIFKLAQGEYVAPEKIENTFAMMPLIAQIFIDGSSLQRFLVAVVVPEESAMREWFRSEVDEATSELLAAELCADDRFRLALLDRMEAHGRLAGLNGYERPRNVHLCADPFTVDNLLLTPTFKAKRLQLRQLFETEMQRLYERTEHPAITTEVPVKMPSM